MDIETWIAYKIAVYGINYTLEKAKEILMSKKKAAKNKEKVMKLVEDVTRIADSAEEKLAEVRKLIAEEVKE